MMLYCSDGIKMLYACTVLGIAWGFHQPGSMRPRTAALVGSITRTVRTSLPAGRGADAFRENDEDPLFFDSFFPQDHAVGILYKRKQQLWIDLRESSLFPHEANTFLMDQLFNDDPAVNGDLEKLMKDPKTSSLPLFDGALVSETMLETIIRRRSSPSSVARNSPPPYLLLYTPFGTDQLLIDESVSQKSYVIGRTTICDSATNLDPLLALETVIDEQNWLLVDYKDQRTARASVDQVVDVLQLLASPSASFTIGKKRPSSSAFALQGGIAVVCSDVNSFVKLDAKLAEIQSAASLGGTVKMQSGLIVPAVGGQQSSATMSPSVPTMALVLPFDLDMWKAADDMRDLNQRNAELLP
jgi:hypothetical protein